MGSAANAPDCWGFLLEKYMINCKKCKIELTEKNTYKRAGRKAIFPVGYYRYCKKCYNEMRKESGIENKKNQLEYKGGGNCSICGYNKCIDALEFHHLDPLSKEEKPSNLKRVTNERRWKKEIDKCIVVCSNCHREIHAGMHEFK